MKDVSVFCRSITKNFVVVEAISIDHNGREVTVEQQLFSGTDAWCRGQAAFEKLEEKYAVCEE